MPELMVSQKISLRNLGDLGVSAVKNWLHLSHRRGAENAEMTQRRSGPPLFFLSFHLPGVQCALPKKEGDENLNHSL